MPRIVSLIASATEIVSILGFKDDLVGRSHECDFPPEVKQLPFCTEPKFDVHGSSGDIDKRVKEILRDALSVYRVDADRLKEMRPDVIVTQAHCEVCAVSEKDVENAVCTWMEQRPRIVSLMPNALVDIWTGIRQVGEALGTSAKAEEVIATLQSRMAAVVDRAKSLHHKPRVACIEWIEPLMAAGNWMPELVEMAGGIDLFGEAGKHAPWMTWEQVIERDPDIMVVLPCGFDIERTRQEMHLLHGLPGWKDLRCVASNQVYLADGNQYFNRPGPRVVESLEILAEILHPTTFRFGHESTGWIRDA